MIFLMISELALSQTFLPKDCFDQGVECSCYKKEDIDKIAKGVVELKTCKIELGEKERFIQERMMNPDGINPAIAWWQEPSIIVGGFVVTLSLTGIITYFVVKGQ